MAIWKDGDTWIIGWRDGSGKRRTKRMGDNRRHAERVLAAYQRDAELVKSGALTALDLKMREHRERPIAEHLSDYLEQCGRNESPEHVRNKAAALRLFITRQVITRLDELTPDRLGRHLAWLARSGRQPPKIPGVTTPPPIRGDLGLSARTVNAQRAAAVAFGQWLVTDGRWHANPLGGVKKSDEARDRRRRRRALTPQETARLIAALPNTAAGQDRADVYTLALACALRRGDLAGITWGDVDLAARRLTIRAEVGKSGRVDELAIPPEALERLQARRKGLASDRVFPTVPRPSTFQRDLERAGIAIVDDAGRVADLHGLRGTAATWLARAGVAPQVVQKYMRHAEVKTTMRHYTHLTLSDVTAAAAVFPRITPDTPADGTEAAELEKTGTCDVPADAPRAVNLMRLTHPNDTQRESTRPTAEDGPSGRMVPKVIGSDQLCVVGRIQPDPRNSAKTRARSSVGPAPDSPNYRIRKDLASEPDSVRCAGDARTSNSAVRNTLLRVHALLRELCQVHNLAACTAEIDGDIIAIGSSAAGSEIEALIRGCTLAQGERFGAFEL